MFQYDMVPAYSSTMLTIVNNSFAETSSLHVWAQHVYNFCSLAVLITLDWIEHLLRQTDPSCHPKLSRTAIGSCGNSNSIILLAVKFKRYEFMFWCLARLVNDLCCVIFTPFLPSYFKFKFNKINLIKKARLISTINTREINGKMT